MKRFLEYLLTAWLVITANFLLPRLVPGDPLLYLTGEASGDTAVTIDQATREKLEQHYGLDQPLRQQYVHYLQGLLTADLGHSIHFRTSVLDLIRQTMGWTLFLMVTAIMLSSAVGTCLGVLSAWKRGTLVDRGLLTLLVGTLAIPSFLLAVLRFGSCR